MMASISTLVRTLVLILCFSIRLPAQVPISESGDFFKADSVAALYPKHSLADLKSLADKLTQPFATDTDKFRAIYRWVCTNIENDYGLYEKNKARREKLKDSPEELRQWNQKVQARFFRKLVREHQTVCTGYAYLVRELAFHAGLPCRIIDGYGRTRQANLGGSGIANHSWNAVELNHQWYVCDATWSSGVIDLEQKKFIQQFTEAYFLTPPALFALNHYPMDSTWLLLDDKPTLQEFLTGPLIYKSAIHYQVSPSFPKTFQVEAAKGKTVTLRFKKGSNLKIEKAELRIIQATTATSAYPLLSQDANGLNTIEHVFTRKGTYVVHLLFNDSYIFTYTVNVS